MSKEQFRAPLLDISLSSRKPSLVSVEMISLGILKLAMKSLEAEFVLPVFELTTETHKSSAVLSNSKYGPFEIRLF